MTEDPDPAADPDSSAADPEPAENISGGDAGGGTEAAFAPAADPATRAEAVVDRLGDIYWQKAYGGRDGFECLVRTILSQNTSDKASQPAHDALLARYGPGGTWAGAGATDAAAAAGTDGSGDETDPDDPADVPADDPADETAPDDPADEAAPDADLAETLAAVPQDELAETISSAGLYNQKSEVIVSAARWVLAEFGSTDAFDTFVREGDPAEVRETLLSVSGVGPKTADCVLLFAGGRGGVFPVDTHVHRIARRMGLAPADADHEAVREHLERDVPAAKCGFGHTATIQFGREYCTARKPACLDDPEACPLADRCDQVGVVPETGEVVDPAEAAGDG